MRTKNVTKGRFGLITAWLVVCMKNFKKISTRLLPCGGWFCPVASEPVKPYFTRLLRVLSFCLEVSKGVAFCENGVVNGVVKRRIKCSNTKRVVCVLIRGLNLEPIGINLELNCNELQLRSNLLQLSFPF